MMKVLGIETSCDETGVAVVEDGTRILCNAVSSQVEIHAPYGGVVPELASRNHIRNLRLLVEHVFREMALSYSDLDGIAVTRGPGLVGSLLVGLNYAKSIAYAHNLPLIPVHHLEGHIYSPFINGSTPPFPFVCLLASGGHTILLKCLGHGDYQALGQTRDDAAGEAFDKVASILGLPYPGGPAIEAAAQSGNPKAVHFPRPLVEEGLDFSFSGLKTAVLYHLGTNGEERKGRRGRKGVVGTSARGKPQLPALSESRVADLAASFQQAVVEVLAKKAAAAVETTGIERFAVAGGVAANQPLRKELNREVPLAEDRIHYAPIELCVDNGAMIAAAGYYRLKAGQVAGLDLNVDPSLPLC